MKLHSLLQDLYYGSTPVLGKMIGLIYVIEWQKRGPPHAHILAICDAESKPRTLEDYDSIVCAEIPDEGKFSELHTIITKFMMHGPCGTVIPIQPAWKMENVPKNFQRILLTKLLHVMVILITSEERMGNIS